MLKTVLFDFIIGFIYLFLGWFIWLQQKKNINTIFFLLFSFFCGITAVIESFIFILAINYHIYNRLADNSRFIFFTLGLLSLIQFFLHFPEKTRFHHRKITYLLYIPAVYIIVVALFGSFYTFVITADDMIKTRNFNYYIFTLTVLIFMVAIIVIIVKKFLQIKSEIYRKQLKSILLGLCSGLFIIQIFGFIPLTFNITIRGDGIQIGAIIMCINIFYTILKYKAFDLKTVVQYSLFYSIILMFMFIPLISLPLLFVYYFQFLSDSNQVTLWGILCAGYVLLLNFTLIPQLNIIALKRRRTLDQEIDQFNKIVHKIDSRKKLQTEIYHLIATCLYTKDLFLLTLNKNQNYSGIAEISHQVMEIPKVDAEWLSSFDRVISSGFIKDGGGKTALLREFNIMTAVQLMNDDSYLGILALTGKNTRKPYYYEEMKFLNKLGIITAALLNKINIVEKNIQKNNFLINVAHEIKTPLTIMINYLEKDIQNRGLSEDLAIVKNNTLKLKRDIVNFLDLEKLSREQTFYNHEQTVDFSLMVQTKILFFTELAYQKNITIHSTIAPSIFIKIDPYAGDRIINNLLDNAIKYTNPGGNVEVCLYSSETMVFMKVSDDGIGISREEQKNIFIPYYQVVNQKRNIQGIGIGLSIVNKILEEIKGEIYVESELDKGTSFTVVFSKFSYIPIENLQNEPVYSYPLDNNLIIRLKEETYTPEKNTIFIIEDNLYMLSYLQNGLSDQFNVYYAVNGLNALDKISGIPLPDIIVSDIMMDLMDGYEFYKNIQQQQMYAYIPFIFLSAKSSYEEELDGITSGAIDFIVKPFSLDILKAKINSIINQNKLLKDMSIREIENKIKQLLHSTDININTDNNQVNPNFYNLTPREKEIVNLLIRGYEYKEISSILEISINTIKPYISNIYKKLNIHNKVELINKYNGSVEK